MKSRFTDIKNTNNMSIRNKGSIYRFKHVSAINLNVRSSDVNQKDLIKGYGSKPHKNNVEGIARVLLW